MLDSAEDVKQKLKKVNDSGTSIKSQHLNLQREDTDCSYTLQAFCEPGKVEGNGILAFARYVLFPILAGDSKQLF